MIYDCFTFFNELDILELRLNILNPYVDKFVLVESTRTHSNIEKELLFEKNKSRFQKFSDKIIHIVVDSFPEINNSWTIENHQRNCILDALKTCSFDDLILISDVDEIPKPELLLNSNFDNGIYCFVQDLFFFFLNYKDLNQLYWLGGTRVLKYKVIINENYNEKLVRYNTISFPKDLNIGLSPTKIRLYENCNYIFNAGWHFTYLGGTDAIISKVKAFAHQELNTDSFLSINRIEKCLNSGNDIFGRPNHKFITVTIDNNYPKYLLDNILNYTELVRPQIIHFHNYLFFRLYQILMIKIKLFFKCRILFPIKLILK